MIWRLVDFGSEPSFRLNLNDLRNWIAFARFSFCDSCDILSFHCFKNQVDFNGVYAGVMYPDHSGSL